MFTIAVICGGPSPERGISLNSARSILDHLSSKEVEIRPLYVDRDKQFYAISPGQLYSNTPSDFDFKLSNRALDRQELTLFLQQAGLVFPAIHGAFGEDGELQALLEELNIPFVGSGSQSCRLMYDKMAAKRVLQENGFPVIPSLLLEQPDLPLIEQFFKRYGKGVIKPTRGGSSLGVYVADTPGDVLAKWEGGPVLLEAFCTGREFTLVVLENGEPLSLVPTEIEMDYKERQIFDYRRKYLPTNQVAYHTPPRFDEELIAEIRKVGEKLFKLFQMRDFVRLDGWVSPSGTLYFTDINPLSGLEQNSFFFRQAATAGMTHAEALAWVVRSSCKRYGLHFPDDPPKWNEARLPVFILFGGSNAERQVSLMSGTNVWLKLLRSSQFAPTPFLYDGQGDVWELPYGYALDHTVEEILDNCRHAAEREKRTSSMALKGEPSPLPKKHTLAQFLSRAQREQAFVFIAMHGGVGEDGTLQAMLEERQIPFNGSDAYTSQLGMDKFLSGKVVEQLFDPDLLPLPKVSCSQEELSQEGLWERIVSGLNTDRVIVKPQSDGCSAGIVLLQSELDLQLYCSFLQRGAKVIPPRSFAKQPEPVELPFSSLFLFEPFIETDGIAISHYKLIHHPKQGWIELTVGVLEEGGSYRVLNPSITIAEGSVLSLEEKFQGGTGVNLTPPPEEILSKAAVAKIKGLVEKIAKALRISNYARIDIFFNRLSEKLIFIEANTLPGLTPSTVFYHQGLAEDPPLTPAALLEKIIAACTVNLS
jgi:D-alanine--D-alanine ligase